MGLLTFHDILTEHEKDVKILQEVTLDILIKTGMNKYKAKCALDIITNYLNSKYQARLSITKQRRWNYFNRNYKITQKASYCLEYARWWWIYFWNFY